MSGRIGFLGRLRSYFRRRARSARHLRRLQDLQPRMQWLGCESLEGRVLLSAPTFATALTTQNFTTGAALTIGINGADADNDALTITASTDNPGLQAVVVNGNQFARLHFVEADGVTVIGDIVIQLFDQQSPTAVQRFVTLATNEVAGDGTLNPAGEPFYTDVVVHRVIPGFMIQTGDAENGNGTGGSPLPNFNDSFDPTLSFAGAGVLAMANSGANTNDSQFFITAAPTSHLDGVHMIFGQLISGQDIYNNIINRPRDSSDRPLSPPLMESVEIFDNPQAASVILVPQAGFAGGAANVTVSLNDGTGNITEQTFVANVLGLSNPGAINVTTGSNTVVFPQINGNDGSALDFSATTTLSGATVSADDAAKSIRIQPPTGFTGFFDVTVTAGKTTGNQKPATQTFRVFAQADDQPQGVSFISGNAVAGAASPEGSDLPNRLYLAQGASGLSIYDLSDPDSPVLLGSFDTDGSATDVIISGHTAFIADGANGLLSLDISNPANIQLLDRVPSVGTATGLARDGDTLFLADLAGGVASFDVSDPANLFELDRVQKASATYTLGPITSVEVGAQHTLYAIDQNGQLAVFAAGQPQNLRFMNRIATGSGGFLTSQPFGSDIDVDEHLLVVADANLGLLVFDIKSPLSPRLVGTHFMLFAGAKTVALINETAIVGTTSAGGYTLVDVSTPSAPVQEQTFATPVTGGQAIIAGDNTILPMGATGSGLVSNAVLRNRHTIETHTRLSGVMRTSQVGRYDLIDSNGVRVIVQVRNGTIRITTTNEDGGNIREIEVLEGSDKTSITIITPRGTTTTVGRITITGSLGILNAPTVDVTNDITATQSIGKLILHSVSGHQIQVGAATGRIKAMSLQIGQVKNTSIDSQMPINQLYVGRWIDDDATADVIETPWIVQIRTRSGMAGAGLAGDFQADLLLSGRGVDSRLLTLGRALIDGQLASAKWVLDGNAGLITTRGIAATFAGNFTGAVRVLRVGGDLAGKLAAADFGVIDITGNLTSATILAGADLGADAALGGTAVNADTFTPGSIVSLRVGGNVTASVIGAGLNPTDGVLNNDNDVIVGAAASEIRRIMVVGTVDGDSLIAAGEYPPVAQINGLPVDPLTDPRFLPITI